MIRSASFLPMPGDRHEDRLVLGHDRELEVGRRSRPDDGQGDLGPDPVDGQQQREETQFLSRSEAVERLLVLAHEVERVQLQDLPGLSRGQDRRRSEDPVSDPADLDDQRIGGDGADDPFDRCDHRVTRWL